MCKLYICNFKNKAIASSPLPSSSFILQPQLAYSSYCIHITRWCCLAVILTSRSPVVQEGCGSITFSFPLVWPFSPLNFIPNFQLLLTVSGVHQLLSLHQYFSFIWGVWLCCQCRILRGKWQRRRRFICGDYLFMEIQDIFLKFICICMWQEWQVCCWKKICQNTITAQNICTAAEGPSAQANMEFGSFFSSLNFLFVYLIRDSAHW